MKLGCRTVSSSLLYHINKRHWTYTLVWSVFHYISICDAFGEHNYYNRKLTYVAPWQICTQSLSYQLIGIENAEIQILSETFYFISQYLIPNIFFI